ncbi:MAG TPA: AEC family transporter [Bacteroidales bacterium]|nr:AEC family transporter [Bacteroidales bacterium]
MFILAVVVLIGATAARFGVLTGETKDMLSRVIFNISLPLMLFSNFLKLDATPRLIANSFTVVTVSFLVILFMLIAGWAFSKIYKISTKEIPVFRTHSMFGNTIFLGFPLIAALYGEEGLLYASMFQLVSTIMMWTVGVVVLTHGNGKTWKQSLRKVINPNTIATVAGLLLFMFSIKLPKIIITPLSELGSANTWLSMLYIGALLVLSDVGGILKRKSIYLVSFNRLLLIPALIISIFYLFGAVGGLTPDKLVASVIILEASMPCMVTVVIMAKEMGSDDRQAAGNVFISTIISILTLPLVALAVERFI